MVKITRDKSSLGGQSVGRPHKRWNDTNNRTAEDTKKNKQFAYIKEEEEL